MNKIIAGTAGFAGFAVVTAFWNQIKGFFTRFKSVFIVTVNIDYRANDVIIRYFWKHFRRGILDIKTYKSENMFVRPKKSYEMVGFEDIGQSLTFFQGWRPIFVSRDKDNNRSAISLSFIRGTFNIEKLLLNALREFNNFEKDNSDTRYYIRRFFGVYSDGKENAAYAEEVTKEGSSSQLRPIGFTWEDLGSPVSKLPFSFLFYPDETQNFIQYIERWKGSEGWYKDRGLMWRMGALLLGPPGTGKTSFVKALGQYLDLPIDIYDLISMSNEELTSYWRRSLNRAPCIVLIEDIDRIFNGDKLIQQNTYLNKGKLTMDCLLNVISGVEPADGILVFITANDISKVDKSLGVPNENEVSTRPGRLDKMLTFDIMSTSCRRALAELILSDCEHLINEVVREGDGETGAQFSKRCADIALREFWKDG
jgi:hypothetical protein